MFIFIRIYDEGGGILEFSSTPKRMRLVYCFLHTINIQYLK
jgi:hypothetical protein